MTNFESLGFFLLTCASLSLSACSGDSGAPGAGGAGSSTTSVTSASTGLACADPQAKCGASCAACGCPACAEAFSPCSVVGDCVEGTLCHGNIPCGFSGSCPSLCLPEHTGGCDAMPCEPGQACSPWIEGTSLCFIPSAKGEACDSHVTMACAAGLYCNSSVLGTCEPQVPPGGACEDTASCTAGFYCSVTTHKCVKTLVLGQSCNVFYACANGLYCDLADSADKPTCQPSAESGEACHNGINACKSKKACKFPAGAACEINYDCQGTGEACCEAPGGAVCQVYSPSCLTPVGTCP